MQIAAYPHEMAVEVFKALSDGTRLRILTLLLAAGELCVCEVEATLEITQPRASRALAALRRAGLVQARRDGAWMHYSVRKDVDPLVRSLFQGLRKSLADDPRLADDAANLERACC